MNEKIKELVSKVIKREMTPSDFKMNVGDCASVRAKETNPINAFLLSLPLDPPFYYLATGEYGHSFSCKRGSPFKLEELESIMYSLPLEIYEMVSIEFIHHSGYREGLCETTELLHSFAGRYYPMDLVTGNTSKGDK